MSNNGFLNHYILLTWYATSHRLAGAEDLDKVDQILAEKRAIAIKGRNSLNHPDHVEYNKGNPVYGRMKTYITQLEQVLNPKAIRKAVEQHDKKFKGL